MQMASFIVKTSPADSPLRMGLIYSLEEVSKILQLDPATIQRLHESGESLECAGFVLDPSDDGSAGDVGALR